MPHSMRASRRLQNPVPEADGKAGPLLHGRNGRGGILFLQLPEFGEVSHQELSIRLSDDWSGDKEGSEG